MLIFPNFSFPSFIAILLYCYKTRSSFVYWIVYCSLSFQDKLLLGPLHSLSRACSLLLILYESCSEVSRVTSLHKMSSALDSEVLLYPCKYTEGKNFLYFMLVWKENFESGVQFLNEFKVSCIEVLWFLNDGNSVGNFFKIRWNMFTFMFKFHLIPKEFLWLFITKVCTYQCYSLKKCMYV